MKKCILVNRVSSSEQEETGYSLQAQERHGTSYAECNKMKMLKVFTFQESASKTNENRKFNEVLAFIFDFCKGSVEPLHVIVEKADRWGRLHGRKEILQALIKRKDVILHYYKEKKVLDDTCSPSDFFIDDMFTTMNKFLSANIGVEAKKGMLEKARQGWLPAKPPLGYKNNHDKKEDIAIQVVPDEAEFVKKIYELRANKNLSYQSIVNEMKKDHILPNRLKHGLYKSKVEKVLKNPFYEGKFLFSGEMHEGKHDIFLEREVIEKVKNSFQKSGLNLGKKHRGIFSDYLKCSECGCQITFQPKQKKSGRTYHLYACANGKKNHTSLKGMYEKEENISDKFGEAISNITISNEIAERVSSELKQEFSKSKERVKRTINIKTEAIQSVLIQKDQVYDHYCDAVIDEELFKRRTEALDLSKSQIEKEIRELKLQLDDSFIQNADNILELAKDMKLLWLSRSDEERVEFLKKILWNPFIYKGTIKYQLKTI